MRHPRQRVDLEDDRPAIGREDHVDPRVAPAIEGAVGTKREVLDLLDHGGVELGGQISSKSSGSYLAR